MSFIVILCNSKWETVSIVLGHFPFVRTGQPVDHYQTGYFDNEIGFFQGFLLKNHLLPAHYLGFDWSSWIVLINSESLITKGRVWPVSSDKWKVPLKNKNGPIFLDFNNLMLTKCDITPLNCPTKDTWGAKLLLALTTEEWVRFWCLALSDALENALLQPSTSHT